MRRMTKTATLLTSSALLVLLGACSSGSGDTAAESPTAAATSEAPAATETPAETASETAAASSTYTLDDVAAHATQADCWAAINGNVYDLTQWISAHPGGSDKIIALCGTDGTAAFTGEHGNEGEPNERLSGFQIGVLG